MAHSVSLLARWSRNLPKVRREVSLGLSLGPEGNDENARFVRSVVTRVTTLRFGD
jgi:hypothetical protein